MRNMVLYRSTKKAKVCPSCEKPFMAASTQIFCNELCALKRQCMVCGKTVYGNAFCSQRCRGINQLKKFGEPQTCSFCDHSFISGYSFYYKSFCSKGCFVGRLKDLGYSKAQIKRYVKKVEEKMK